MTHTGTRGPVFIVGMPRSGTTLFRKLLNQHSEIYLSPVETQFLPHAIQALDSGPVFTDAAIATLLDIVERSTFFSNIRSRLPSTYDRDKVMNELRRSSWTSLYYDLLKCYGIDVDQGTIWGDKTPSYLRHMPLLKQSFPTAKFLHILRDPRDVSLSVKSCWGKSIYRAATDWRSHVEEAQCFGQVLSAEGAYYELLYENLVTNPSQTLCSVCDFLEIEFQPEVARLDEPAGHLGDAGTTPRIVASNTRKFTEKLTPPTIERLEQLLLPTMAEVGYEAQIATSPDYLSTPSYFLLRLYDSFAKMQFYIQDKGGLAGLRYYWRTLRTRI